MVAGRTRHFRFGFRAANLRFAAFAAALVLIAGNAGAQAPRVEGDAGVAALLRAAAEDFALAKPALRLVRVLENSSAGVLDKLCRGEISIAGAARAAAKAERETCARENVELIELPVANDAIALVVNPANTWAKQLTVAQLKRAWLDAPGKARSWKQVNEAWPETPLKLYGPAPKLGLAAHALAVLNAGATESTLALRTDVSATEVLSVVADGVARDRGALGLLDQATYAAHMKRVRLVSLEGMPSYPLYVYTSAKALQDPGAKAYLDHMLANAGRLAPKAGLTPLSASAYQLARQRLVARQ